VINAGIPGTDTWQHEILLTRFLKATNPHVVVLALYVTMSFHGTIREGLAPRARQTPGASGSCFCSSWSPGSITICS
jgi:hypothetical protein